MFCEGDKKKWDGIQNGRILMDAHVHLRDSFGVFDFLEKGLLNLCYAIESLDFEEQKYFGVLCVVDSRREDGFGRLVKLLDKRDAPMKWKRKNWKVRETKESISLSVSLGRRKLLFTVAGRQLVSQSGLELLAIGTRHQFEEGKHVAEMIRDVAQAGAVPIVPWGAGKWLGRRGNILKQLVRDPTLPQFFLGDSANRPAFWPKSSLFREAKEHGIGNLPGSDPLPFSSEVQRVGSFGAALDCSLDLEKPAQDLKRKLLDLSLTLHQFGRRVTPVRFLRNQFKMQFRKLTQ